MPDSHTIFVILNYISVFVMLIASVFVTRQAASRMQKLAMVVIFSLLICCIGFLFRIEATGVEGLILGQKLIYSFVTFGMFYMLLFFLDYCDYKISKTVTVIFQLLNAFITVAVLTLDHHQLFYKSYWMVQENGYPALEKEYGFLHTLAIVLFALYMVAAFVIVLIYSIHNIKHRSAYVWRLWLAVVLPCASYVVPKVLDLKNDLQPMAFAAFTVVVIYMIYKNNLYDVDNIAAQFAVQTLDEAIIVIDGTDNLQGCNQLAKKLIPELNGLNLDDSISGVSRILDSVVTGNTADIVIADKIYAVTVAPVNNADDRLMGSVIRLRDVTLERKYTELLKSQREHLTSQVETLSYISYRDDLTGLANRRSYEEALQAIRESGNTVNISVWAVDINGLKQTNDTKGHAYGDALIRAAGKVLTDVFDKDGTVYRIGGDEFFVLIDKEGIDNSALAEKLEASCAAFKDALVGGLSLAYGFAAGAEFPESGIDSLMIAADKRMYENKWNYYETNGLDRRQIVLK